ncbi:hypothetical protein GWI33_002669 [Rhynchophorus ferrugineus]|uniref:Cyclin-dependent kinases regulatory subunit n=1 Tax=Rhynchophorus ferrugineus TaxID=354439 RepID=A0A834IMQ6_RHYFE|nr:hypothetical protein GWI33_002669 [Rhynchophorus ferrugineus]
MMPAENIQYSEKYQDDHYEYRHVILPPDVAKLVPRPHLMTETEWRNLVFCYRGSTESKLGSLYAAWP